jgi:hypothetical protein
MNIFAVNMDPMFSAQQLPDKHIVKMPLETCQMISIVYSKWYHNWGEIYRLDGEPYSTKKGAFRNHPCTQWAAKNEYNLAWLIAHGCALTTEYKHRYGKVHACAKPLFQAKKIFHSKTKKAITIHSMVDKFARAMPENIKHDKTIDDVTAYQKYLNTKPWVKDNYVRSPERKPIWICDT